MLSSTERLACLLLISLTICAKPSKAQDVYKPLTPAEWALRFRCDANATGGQEQCQRSEPEGPNYCPKEEDVCSRHHGDWMWKYADELNPEFQVLVKEKSIDERLANIIYATITTREFDMEFQKFAANDPSLEQYFEQLVVGPQVNYDLCGAHLRSMLGLIDEYRHKLDLARQENKSNDLDEKYIRLARVLDSNGRYMSGTLSGKIISPGAYEQCINSQLSLLGDSTLVGMRFCLAGLSLEPNLSHELRLRKRFDHERSALAFHVALCLPESCHSKSLMHHRQLIQRWLEIEFKFPSSIYLHETANVTILHCMVDKQSPMGLPTSGKLLIVVVSAWLMLVSYATYRTCARKSKHNITLVVQNDKRPPIGLEMEQTKRRQTWESCLSVVNNWKDFMEVKEDDQQQQQQKRFTIDLDVLNPIKVIACVWATLVHAFIAIHIGSNNLLRDHKLIESDHNMGLVIVSPLVVETYFVISGVLTTYLALKRVDKYEQSKSEATTWGSSSLSSSFGLRRAYRNFLELLKKCLVLIVGRYLRLLPLFYLAFWFKKGIFQYIGSAPLWNFGFNKDSGGQCRNESWWSPLSLASVYDPILRKCIPQSYTITTDMIFIIISAPLIFLINKYQRTVVALMVSVGFCSFLASLAEFVTTNKSIVWNMADYKSYGMLQMLSTPLSYIYTSPEYRLFSVFFGIIVGWLVYRYDHKVSSLQMVTNNTKRSNSMASHSHWLWRLVTLFAFTFPFLISLLATFRLEFKSLFRPYHRTLFPYYFMSAKILWALSSAIVLLRLLTDWGQSAQVAWMKSKFWRILAKLNYSVLLIHLDLLLLDWQIQTNETVASKYKIISTLTFAHSASIFIGMLVYVLVENPIDKLVKRYII